VLSRQLSETQSRATADPQLFSDSAWISELQHVADAMETAAADIRAVTPPASLVHIHVRYMRIAVAYQVRIRDLRTVIACLRRFDLGAASVAFGDVARVGELLAGLGGELQAALAQEA
jgi:hypothetical protein